MSRGKRKQAEQRKPLLGLVLILACAGLLFSAIQNFSGGFGGFALLLLLVAGTVVIVPRLLRRRRHRSLLNKANGIVGVQIEQLVRRRAQLVRQDAYGKLQFDKWAKEIDYFITQHIGPSLTRKEQLLLAVDRVQIAQIIDSRVETAVRDKPIFSAFSESMTPSEFEYFCAEQLRLSGWNARVTLQSRDQGVDVIADQGGVRVVLQCKLYGGPVGNRAVQEAAAGKAHEQAQHGIVVTNSRYTAAAEQLASTNGILLLHYSDLANLHTLVR